MRNIGARLSFFNSRLTRFSRIGQIVVNDIVVLDFLPGPPCFFPYRSNRGESCCTISRTVNVLMKALDIVTY